MYISSHPPRIIVYLIRALLATGALTAVAYAFGGISLQSYLGLSSWGIDHFFLWQPFTFLLVAPGPLSFGLAINYFFKLYLIRSLGTTLVQRVGSVPFLRFFILTGAIAGTGAALLPLKGVLLGSTCAIYALLTAWTMFNSRSQILLLALPLQTRYLVGILLGLNLLLDFASGDYLNGVANLLGVLSGYLYALIAWNLRSPFPFTARFDEAILAWKKRAKRL